MPGKRNFSGLVVTCVFLPGTLPAAVPTLPGDCNYDWSVDMLDLGGFLPCLAGPGEMVFGACACYDIEGDDDNDLHDFCGFQSAYTGTQALTIMVATNADDGTEVNQGDWYADGFAPYNYNRMGAATGETYDLGLRFHLPQVIPGEAFVYARLVIPGSAEGLLDTAVLLRIVGVARDSAVGFDVARPSEQLPKTCAASPWVIDVAWPEVSQDHDCSPLHRYSPDIACVINEIVARPAWGGGPDGRTLVLVVEDDGSPENNYVTCEDYREIAVIPCVGQIIAPQLELYRTVRATFLGKELLGRPTDDSVTLNVLSLMTLDAYVEYGAAPGLYTDATSVVTWSGGTPIEIVVDGLDADTEYFYRLRYRIPGASVFEAGPQRSFRTQRPPGGAFKFTVTTDSHLQDMLRNEDQNSLALYCLALTNALADKPDFHLDLGDTFHCEFYRGRDALDDHEAWDRHLDQRSFFDLVCHSAPFFFALGNHEGEQGWRLDGTPNNLAVWATLARKALYPLPSPDEFYSGSLDEPAFVGLRENYYAWEWGDALLVVLDPYWYTTIKPHDKGGTPGSGDNWDWTLGQTQYEWLVQTLEQSDAPFKFVFSHQVTGGVDSYGRGGVEAASHAVGGVGSFEWGGEDLAGNDVFDLQRPGWGRPIHEVMVDNHVTIFFHGHDHVFVKQDLDGIVYQECPQPDDATYDEGFYLIGQYFTGDKINNSGHLRVTVSPSQAIVDYVRAYLPGDGWNGEVAYSYTVSASEP